MNNGSCCCHHRHFLTKILAKDIYLHSMLDAHTYKSMTCTLPPWKTHISEGSVVQPVWSDGCTICQPLTHTHIHTTHTMHSFASSSSQYLTTRRFATSRWIASDVPVSCNILYSNFIHSLKFATSTLYYINKWKSTPPQSSLHLIARHDLSMWYHI